MLAGIIVVMQVEGHVLQPFLLGRAVKLHPLAVLLAIAVGIIVGGIVGALLAVPLLAFTKSFIQYLAGAAGAAPGPAALAADPPTRLTVPLVGRELERTTLRRLLDRAGRRPGRSGRSSPASPGSASGPGRRPHRVRRARGRRRAHRSGRTGQRPLPGGQRRSAAPGPRGSGPRDAGPAALPQRARPDPARLGVAGAAGAWYRPGAAAGRGVLRLLLDHRGTGAGAGPGRPGGRRSGHARAARPIWPRPWPSYRSCRRQPEPSRRRSLGLDRLPRHPAAARLGSPTPETAALVDQVCGRVPAPVRDGDRRAGRGPAAGGRRPGRSLPDDADAGRAAGCRTSYRRPGRRPPGPAGPPGRRLLAAAAVLGAPATWRLVPALADLDDAAAAAGYARAIELGLLVAGGRRAALAASAGPRGRLVGSAAPERGPARTSRPPSCCSAWTATTAMPRRPSGWRRPGRLTERPRCWSGWPAGRSTAAACTAPRSCWAGPRARVGRWRWPGCGSSC